MLHLLDKTDIESMQRELALTVRVISLQAASSKLPNYRSQEKSTMAAATEGKMFYAKCFDE